MRFFLIAFVFTLSLAVSAIPTVSPNDSPENTVCTNNLITLEKRLDGFSSRVREIQSTENITPELLVSFFEFAISSSGLESINTGFRDVITKCDDFTLLTRYGREPLKVLFKGFLIIFQPSVQVLLNLVRTAKDFGIIEKLLGDIKDALRVYFKIQLMEFQALIEAFSKIIPTNEVPELDIIIQDISKNLESLINEFAL